MRCAQGSAALAVFLAVGCRATVEAPQPEFPFDVPATYGGDLSSAPPGAPTSINSEAWWKSFGSSELDQLIDGVLAGNLELLEAWTRLDQAGAAARVTGAARTPTVDLNASARDQKLEQTSGGANQIPIRLGDTYSLGASLSYELDLFGRIRAELERERATFRATEADLRATALTLTGTAADTWFEAVASQAGMVLLEEQIQNDEDLLQVTENRLATGSGSLLDVLQQQRLLEATRAELPRLAGEVERARNALHVLLGQPPGGDGIVIPSRLPALPPLPGLDVPAALLTHRPDLVAAIHRIESADRDVAAGIAERYPRLSLSASFDFDGNEISELFERNIRSIAGSLVAPLVDGGRRRAEVDRRTAALDGALLALSRSFLIALREVEDALSLERRGIERTLILERQREIAEREVAQARRRYTGGVDSYLSVLTATQSLQALERQLVDERVAVLRARAQLLRALGGPWTESLASSPPSGSTESGESTASAQDPSSSSLHPAIPTRP